VKSLGRNIEVYLHTGKSIVAAREPMCCRSATCLWWGHRWSLTGIDRQTYPHCCRENIRRAGFVARRKKRFLSFPAFPLAAFRRTSYGCFEKTGV